MLFYCGQYFHHRDGHTENRLPSFAAELVAFSGAMFGLVISDNMLLLAREFRNAKNDAQPATNAQAKP